METIINSGITMGSITAILLNLIFNVWGGNSNLVTKVLPTRSATTCSASTRSTR